MTTTTTKPPSETTTATEKQDTPYFADRAERENYYRWVYCVKHGITDMESYGVRPLGDEKQPIESPVRRKHNSPRQQPIELEMSQPMVTVLRAVSGVVDLSWGAIRFCWNLCALFMVLAIVMTILGVITA